MVCVEIADTAFCALVEDPVGFPYDRCELRHGTPVIFGCPFTFQPAVGIFCATAQSVEFDNSGDGIRRVGGILYGIALYAEPVVSVAVEVEVEPSERGFGFLFQ